MPKNKKKFIDRKNAVTFHLVHRSQQDPLAADESAPQHVLIPVHKKTNNKDHDKRLKEQQKYGILYDDDYNYLQHLRDVKSTAEWVPAPTSDKTKTADKPKLQLPSSVFASAVEEKVGLLNKAAPHSGPRLDLDPDVVAAMDEDFDYDDPENELEDNFMELANAEISESEDECSDVDSDFNEGLDEVNSLEDREYTFRDEETKSRFTEYSMSSSVMRRNNQLTLLDDKFEQMFATYDDTEIGALDLDEIEGYIPDTTNILLLYSNEYRINKEKDKFIKKDCTLQHCIKEESDSDNEELVKINVPEKEKWDCESILSTYSNIYNHPKLITDPKPSKIKVNMKTGIPVDVLNSSKLTSKALLQLDENYVNTHKGSNSVGAKSIISTLSTLSIRPPSETLEQKKERKKLLKEYRKERRFEKKINTQAFKDEHKKQIKIAINNRNNVQGNKIL